MVRNIEVFFASLMIFFIQAALCSRKVSFLFVVISLNGGYGCITLDSTAIALNPLCIMSSLVRSTPKHSNLTLFFFFFSSSYLLTLVTDVTFSYSQGSPWSVGGSQNDTVSGMDVLKLYEMGTDHRVRNSLCCAYSSTQARDMAILAGMALAYRVAYYFVLKVWHTGKR